MQTITLHKIPRQAVEDALKWIAQTDDLVTDGDSAFFVGSVSAAKKQDVEQFLELAHHARVAEMAQYAAIVITDLVYAILVRRKGEEAGYRLFVVVQFADPWRDQECIFSIIVKGIEVTGAPRSEWRFTGLTFWEVLRAVFWPKKGKEGGNS